MKAKEGRWRRAAAAGRIMMIIITGNPGVGKHTSARLVAERLGASILDINRIAIDNKDEVVASETGKGLDVDPKKLGRLVSQQLRREKGSVVIVGHLAPYVFKRQSRGSASSKSSNKKMTAMIGMVAVLRRSPYDLAVTLQKRGYSEQKAKENVASEVLGVTLYDALEVFGRRKVAEFDTTGRTPEQTADEIILALLGKTKKRRAGSVDWLSLVSERGDIEKFFDYDAGGSGDSGDAAAAGSPL